MTLKRIKEKSWNQAGIPMMFSAQNGGRGAGEDEGGGLVSRHTVAYRKKSLFQRGIFASW